MAGHSFSIADAASRLLALTAEAWQVRPQSPRAVARRAPHGYVPRRQLQRLRGTTAQAVAGNRPAQ